MVSILLAGRPRRAAILTAAWLAAGVLAGPRARAQSLGPVTGLQIQTLGSGIPAGPRITLDGPRSKGPAAAVYVDGKLVDSQALVKLNPDDISTINVLNASVINLVAPGAYTTGALFVTTRQHATDSAVAKFSRRVARLRQSRKPAADETMRLKSLDMLPRPRLYVDGQPADSAAVAAVNPIDIARVYVLKGAAAAALSPQVAGRDVVSIVTNRRAQQRRVKKFEQRLQQLEAEHPLTPASIEQYNAQQPADVRYYLNGQLATLAAARAAYQTITSVRPLRGKQAAAYAHDPTVTEVFLVETKP